MDDLKKIANAAIGALVRAGAEQAECAVKLVSNRESNALGRDVYLLREMDTYSVYMAGHIGKRAANITINATDEEAIEKAAGACMDMAKSGGESKEEAEMKAATHMPLEVAPGTEQCAEADFGRFYRLFEDYLRFIAENHPDIVVDSSIHHKKISSFYVNTKGEEEEKEGVVCTSCFEFVAVTDEAGTGKVSVYVSLVDAQTPLAEKTELAEGIEKARKMVGAQELSGEQFYGTLVIDPGFAGYYIALAMNIMSEKGEKGETVSLSPEIAQYTLYSNDELDDVVCQRQAPDSVTVYSIEKGVLVTAGMDEDEKKAHKKAMEEKDKELREKYKHAYYCTRSGNKTYDELIKSIDRGILLGYISGAMPDANGDISGVAQNSFYIENGEVKHPVAGVMISANIIDLLSNVVGVSKWDIEKSKNKTLTPYIAASGASIK